MTISEHSWLHTAKKSAGWLIALGVLEIVAGFVAVSAPAMAGLVATVFVGVAFLIGGGARLFTAFLADSFGAGTLSFLWGLVMAVTGFYFLIRPGLGLATLTLVAAMYFFMDGVTRLILSLRMKPVKGWGWMLASGIVSLVAAVLIGWGFPVTSLWVVGTLVAINLLFSGFTTITLAGAARRVAGAAEQAA
jgi:uncharacterized membrane protein HdeD (DUF308 family)